MISSLSKNEQILLSHLSSITMKGFAYPTPSTFWRTASVILAMASTSRLTQREADFTHVSVRSESGPSQSGPSRRNRPLHAFFVHREADAIEACVQELQKAQFTVSSDCVLNLARCAEQLRSKCYDVIIVEYPGSHCKGSQALQLLHQTFQEITLIFFDARTWERIHPGT